MREDEDHAIEEVARWLFDMTDPAATFGDYVAPVVALPSAGSSAGMEAVGPHEIHSIGEVLWEQLEKTCVPDEQGFANYVETQGKLRALVEGVTGYSLFYTDKAINRGRKGLHPVVGRVPGSQRCSPIALSHE